MTVKNNSVQYSVLLQYITLTCKYTALTEEWVVFQPSVNLNSTKYDKVGCVALN